MSRRIFALFRARLAAQLGSEVVPAAAVLSQGALVGTMCLLVRGELGLFGYALLALSASGALVAIALLGEFGALLREDPARDWAETLPARAVEQRAARGLVVVALLGALTLGALLPAALFAPAEAGLGARAALLALGLGQALFLAAVLLGLQGLLGERVEGLLVAIQTLLVVLAVGGFLLALRAVPWLRALEAGGADWPGALGFLPSAWFAAVLAGPPAGAALPPAALTLASGPLALALLLLARPARAPAGRRTSTLVSVLLAPLHRLAARAWTTPRERGVFELVAGGLPLEREFVLRTYPMIGIPIAFLLVGARVGVDGERQGLLALLLFTPAVYLPVLLAHVPTCASAGARWLLDTAPIASAAIRNGAIKALAVRFLVPLYVLLVLVAWTLGELAFALRLAPAALLASLLVMRALYPTLVRDLPLSTPPDELEVKHDWMGLLMTLVVVLVALAIFAQRTVTTPLRALALFAALLALELAGDFAERRRALRESAAELAA